MWPAEQDESMATYAGKHVNFRDYQTNTYDDPFDADNICDFLSDSSDLIGVSVMANRGFTFLGQNITTYVDVAGPLDVVMHFASPASPVDYLEMECSKCHGTDGQGTGATQREFTDAWGNPQRVV